MGDDGRVDRYLKAPQVCGLGTGIVESQRGREDRTSGGVVR